MFLNSHSKKRQLQNFSDLFHQPITYDTDTTQTLFLAFGVEMGALTLSVLILMYVVYIVHNFCERIDTRVIVIKLFTVLK